MADSDKGRLQEGALSALKTPEKPPAPTTLVPVGPRSAATSSGMPLDPGLTHRAVVLAKTGDPEGMHTLYTHYAPAVNRFVSRVVRDQDEADDITQGVFAKATQTIESYDPGEASFDAWIMRMARGAALDHLRRQRQATFGGPAVPVGDRIEVGAKQARSLRLALEELPEDQQEILILRHIAGLSSPEIADVMGRPEAAVKGLHHRGRRALQAKLAERGAEKRPQASS